MFLQIDVREKERAERGKEYFEEKGWNVDIVELEIGDYLFNGNVVFEYKRIDDFFSSLNDNRLWNQAIDQYENYDYHYIVVEKNKRILDRLRKRWFKNEKIQNQNRYDGMIAELNVFSNVIEKETENQCFKMMNNIAKKVSSNRMLVKKPEIKTSNAVYNWLTMIKGVGVETSSLIVDELDVNSLNDLLELTEEDLIGIKGVGKKTAEMILKTINGE